ncbi:MAG: GHKL domain-containing protein, partial [Lachnospiraceae bacterium]|nr:GHKL domain-containing protein [Lachnospiraceae bacterium]
KDRRWSGLAVVASYMVFWMALFRIWPSKNWDYRVEAWKMALALCILSVLAVCFYKAFHLITVFLVVAFQAIAGISRYATVILLGELGDGLLGLWNWCAGNGLLETEKSFGIAVNAGLIGQWLMEYLVIALVLYLSLKKIVWDFGEKDYSINRTELLFILTPAAVGLMVCVLMRIIIVTMEEGRARLLYDRYPILIFVLPAILLLSLLSILHGVKLFQDMICRNREKSNRIILEKQVMSLQEHMEEMERINSGIRSMKHDMKNTISVIQRLAAGDGKEENVELQSYLSELNRTFETLEMRFKTGNTVVDTLLNMKYHEAVREVPDLNMNVDNLLLPQKLEIPSFDIGVILGNALDNAIEACRKLKELEQTADAFINLSSLQKGNLLILKVENSFDGCLPWKRQDGFPVSDKADKDSHGIGLANIRSTAEKYHGTMDFRVEDRVFVLSVMMKNERRSEDGFWNNG